LSRAYFRSAHGCKADLPSYAAKATSTRCSQFDGRRFLRFEKTGWWARTRAADVLREQTRTDKDGRQYRAFIPAKTKDKDGFPLFKWADIDLAPRTHVEKGVQGERRSIVNDCFALAMKVDHYNATHPKEEPIQVIFNFDEDIEEMKIAKGIEEDDAA
jgi:hypothetical protein